jgi:hypothetical protein
VGVYHFTLHAFGSWPADHSRGHTLREQGYQAPDHDEQQRREEAMTQSIMEFDEDLQKVLIVGTHDICQRRGWRFHGGGTDLTHSHALISWKHFTDWQDARDKLKNLLRFVEGGSRKRVTELEHFDYLLDTYFPDHRGVFWREGMPLPEVPEWVLTGKGIPGASATGCEENADPHPDSR